MNNTEFPDNDNEFEEVTLSKVIGSQNGGWNITRSDSWCFFVPADSPIEPTVGMTARMYGRGIGSTVRGLFLDGRKVYYRTEAEEKEHSDIQIYGADAADWLARWDDGKSVWSIEMGGIGPGYEQCIHITAAEILRIMLDKKYDISILNDPEKSKAVVDEIDALLFKVPVVETLGLSGAQHGAAMNLAAWLYRVGPREVMKDEREKDRHIQVQKSFPGAAASA